MEELDQLIADLYKRWGNRDADSAKVAKVRELYGTDTDGLVRGMYKKFKGVDLDDAKLSTIKGLYPGAWASPVGPPTEREAISATPQGALMDYQGFANKRFTELQGELDEASKTVGSQLDLDTLVSQKNEQFQQELVPYFNKYKEAFEQQFPVRERGWFERTFPGTYAVGKQIASGFGDVLPQTGALLKARIASAAAKDRTPDVFVRQYGDDFQRYLNRKGIGPVYGPFSIDDYLTQENISGFLQENQLTDKYNEFLGGREKFLEEAKGALGYAEKQAEESAASLAGVTQDVRDIRGIQSLRSYIGNAVGNAIWQIPLSVASGGASSFLQEGSIIYDKQLDRLAKENNISKERVIERGLDGPAADMAYDFLAGGLDAFSAGKILKGIRKGWQLFGNAALEGITEQAQGAIENVGASGAETLDQIMDQLTKSYDPKEREGLWARANEFLMGTIGGGAVGLRAALPTREEKIKSLMDSMPIPEEIKVQQDQNLANAIQKQGPDAVPVQPTPGDSQPVAEGTPETKPQEITQAETQTLGTQEELPTPPTEPAPQFQPPARDYQKEYNDAYAAYMEDGNDENGARLVEAYQNLENERIADEKRTSRNPWLQQIKQLMDGRGKEGWAAQLEQFLFGGEGRPAFIPEYKQREWKALVFGVTQPKANKKTIEAFQKKLEAEAGIPRKITMEERKLLEKQIRDVARGYREGRKDRAGFVATLKDIIGRTNLPERVYNKIISTVGKIDFLKTGKVIDFFNYVVKATEDAQWAERIDTLNRTRAKLRDKVKNLPPSLKETATALVRVDPKRISSIDQFEEALVMLAADVAPFHRIKEGGVVVGEQMPVPANAARLAEINDLIQREHAEYVANRDADAKLMEMGSMLDDVDEVTDTSEESTQTRRQAEEKLREGRLAKIEELRNDLKAPKGEFAGKVWRVITSTTNLAKLTSDELKQVIRGLAHASVNGDYGELWKPAMKLWVLDHAKDIPKFSKGGGGSLLRSVIDGMSTGDNINLFLLNKLGTNDRVAKFLTSTGIGKLVESVSKARGELNDFLNDTLIPERERLQKEYKTDVAHAKSAAFRSVFGELIQRHKYESEQEAIAARKADLATSKDASAELLKTDDPKDLIMLSYINEAHELFNRPFSSVQEIIDYAMSVDPASTKYHLYAVEQLKNRFKERFAEMSEVMELERMDEIENWYPLPTMGQKGRFGFDDEETFRPKEPVASEARSLKKRVKRLGTGQFRNPDADANLVVNLSDLLRKYYGNEEIEKWKNFIALNASTDKETGKAYSYTGGQTNQDALRTVLKVILDPQLNSPLEEKQADLINLIQRVWLAGILGGPTKAPLQWMSPVVNTAVRLTASLKNPGLMFGNDSAAKQVLKQHPIGYRKEEAAHISMVEKLDRPTRQTFEKFFGDRFSASDVTTALGELPLKVQEGLVVPFFTSADADANQRAWLAFYLSKLQSLGVDVSKRNTKEFWDNEAAQSEDPVRQEATNYAEQTVNEIGLPSSSKNKSELLANHTNVHRLIFPLMRYEYAFKRRVWGLEVPNLLSSDPERRKEARIALAGNIAEAMLYETWRVAVMGLFWNTIGVPAAKAALEAFGLEIEDDDDEEEISSKLLMSAIAIANTISPAMLPQLKTAQAEFFNDIWWMLTREPGESRKDYVERKGDLFPTRQPGALEGLGYVTNILNAADAVVDIGLDFGPATLLGNITEDNVYTYKDNYGQYREVQLTDDQALFLKLYAWGKVASLMGMSTSETTTLWRLLNKQVRKSMRSSTPAWSGTFDPSTFEQSMPIPEENYVVPEDQYLPVPQ